MVSADPSYYIERIVPSDSRAGVYYRVRLWLKDWRGFKKGTISCSCPAWIFQRKPITEKSCKHTRRIGEVLKREAIAERVNGSKVKFATEVNNTIRGRIAGLLDSIDF